MPAGGYKWEPGSRPPLIGPHSLAKHDVLVRYLRDYIRVVTANRKMERLKLTLVDGFAGGGVYTGADGRRHLGSPLLMLNTMAEAAGELVADGRRVHLDTRFLFVEKSPPVAACLKATLREEGYAGRLGQDVEVLQGAFEEQLDGVLESIHRHGRSGRAIFVLDQYGYSDVTFDMIRRVFHELRKAEVLLTVATDWMLDFLARTPESTKAVRGLELEPERLLAAKDTPHWRRVIQHQLHEHFWKASGAGYYTPFFIVSPDAHRSYWLLHLSNHARARDVMTKVHWSLHNRFHHYGRAGLTMLGYSPLADPQVTGQLPFAFDEDAKERTVGALMDELPERVWQHRDGVAFGQLFAHIVNETPAHSGLVSDALLRLRQEKQVELLGPRGGRLRKDALGGQDIIVPNSQRQLFVLGRQA